MPRGVSPLRKIDAAVAASEPVMSEEAEAPAWLAKPAPIGKAAGVARCAPLHPRRHLGVPGSEGWAVQFGDEGRPVGRPSEQEAAIGAGSFTA